VALAFRSIPLQSAYCASKHAIQGFTESVRSELLHQKSNVRTSIVNMPALNTTQFTWTRNRMQQKPRPAGTIFQAIFQAEVAADAILFAAENERRELMVGYTTVEATLGEKIFPNLLDHYLAKAAWEGSLLPESADPNQSDNFWQPVRGDHGAHGEFDKLSHNLSVQLWLTKHRAGLVGTLLLTSAGFATFLLRTKSRFGVSL
jgi:short chain dehydrogenase